MSYWRWTTGAAMAAVIAVASWSQPQENMADLARSPAGDRVAADATSVAPGPRVGSPWQPGRAELGIHVYWEDNPLDSDEAVRRKARRLVDQVVGLEANAIAVSFPFFVDSIAASSLRPDPRTPAPQRLAIVLDEARRSGLRTTVRPLMDQNNLDAGGQASWRGGFLPQDPSAWFASYAAFLSPYLSLGTEARVETIVVGAELNALQLDPRWRELVGWARAVYPGELAYSANWDAYPSAVEGVPVDIVNIDAYPTLDLDSDATETQIRTAWRAWLDRTAAGELADIVLAEVGGPAESTLLKNPALYHTPGAALDEEMQRRWFAAACGAARERSLGGFYFWKLDFHNDPAAADPDRDRHDSFIGRQAEHAIRSCFAVWGGPA
jgi:hypothetical protein